MQWNTENIVVIVMKNLEMNWISTSNNPQGVDMS